MTMSVGTISLLVLSSLIPILGSAQNYRPLLRADASWVVAVYESPTICGWTSAVNYFISSDTLINGVVYSRLGFNPVGDSDGPPFCPPAYFVAIPTFQTMTFLREDTSERKVYRYDNALGAERLLYDFTAQVGDTLFDYFDDDLGFDDITTVVASIDSVQLNDGLFLRRWNLYSDLWNGIEHDHIEGVGSTFGILHDQPQYYGDGLHFWCYKRSMVDVLWSVVSHCPLPSFVPVEEAAYPATSDVRLLSLTPDGSLILTGNTPADVLIRTVDGRLVLQALLYPGVPNGLSRISPGVYTYVLMSQGKRVGTGRFVMPSME